MQHLEHSYFEGHDLFSFRPEVIVLTHTCIPHQPDNPDTACRNLGILSATTTTATKLYSLCIRHHHRVVMLLVCSPPVISRTPSGVWVSRIVLVTFLESPFENSDSTGKEVYYYCVVVCFFVFGFSLLYW